MKTDVPPLPNSAVVRAALEVAQQYCSPALLHHSIRSWYWAVEFARVDAIAPIDEEMLCVAALLHDVGLVPEFDAARLAFEIAGGHVGWVLAAGAGWGRARRDRVARVIERHMWPAVDPALDREGYLLETATSLDISGGRPDALPEPYLHGVLAAYPRLDLAAEFGACLADQAARKPTSAAARLVARGLDGRLAANPLERIRPVAGAAAAPIHVRPPVRLSTARLVIEPLGAADIPAFVAYRRDPAVARWQSWTPHYSEADAAALVAGQPAGLPDAGDWLQLALHDRADGRLHGDVAIHRLDEPAQPDTFELGVTLAPASQGRGFAAEALRAVLAHLVDDVGAHRVVARCDARNEQVAHLLAAVGMRQESRAVDAEFWKGEWTTTDGWALLASDRPHPR